MGKDDVGELLLKLHPAQFDFYWDDTFTSLFVGGVGSGKTFVGARKALHKALSNPETLGLVAANTQTQLNQSTLVELWEALSELGLLEGTDYVVNRRPDSTWNIASRFTRHEGVVTLRSGAQMVTRSLYNWRPILGLTLGWAWIDEARDTGESAMRAVMSRLRCKKAKKRQLFITTTPNGFDWLYEFFEGEVRKKPELAKFRQYHIARTMDNASNLPGEYLDALLGAYDERLARQELMGEWVDIFRGRVYYAFDRDIHVSEKAVVDKRMPLLLCCDFNATPMTWLVAQKVRKGYRMGETALQQEVLVVADEIVLETSNTQEAAQEFISRGYEPSKTTVFGDAAGHHSTTLSDYAAMSQFGLRDIRAPKSNPAVLDRVAAVNGKLTNARGEVGMLIHPRCSSLIEDFLRVGYKPGSRQLDKGNHDLTHASDAIGYCVVRLWPVHRKGKIAVRGESY